MKKCDFKDSNNYVIFDILIFLVIVVFLFICVFCAYQNTHTQINKKAIIIDCKLLKGSTLETNAVPVVGMAMNGSATVGVGLSTSGHSENFIGAFDCGNYDILISNDKEVFREAINILKKHNLIK
jgi:hypothetical protein